LGEQHHSHHQEESKEEQKLDVPKIEEKFEYDYPCTKMIKNPLTKDCLVTIDDPKVQDDGFFS